MSTKRQIIHCTDIEGRLNDRFIQDCHELFSGKKSGHMGLWRYDDGDDNDPAAGSILWKRLVDNATDYYIPRLEDQSVIQTLKELFDYVEQNNCILVDLGPGTPSHTKMKLIHTLGKKGCYVPVDISNKFLEAALILKDRDIVSNILPIMADFTAEALNIPLQGKRVFIFLGSTIGNIKAGYNTDAKSHASEFIQQIKQQMHQGDILIVGFDSCMDADTVLKCYNDPYSIDVMLAPLFKIARDLPYIGSFDPYAYKPEFQWFSESSQCAHTVIATKDQGIAFDQRTYSIRKGQRFHISNSYKFSENVMVRLFSKAGLSDVSLLGQDDNSMKLVLGRLN